MLNLMTDSARDTRTRSDSMPESFRPGPKDPSTAREDTNPVPRSGSSTLEPIHTRAASLAPQAQFPSLQTKTANPNCSAAGQCRIEPVAKSASRLNPILVVEEDAQNGAQSQKYFSGPQQGTARRRQPGSVGSSMPPLNGTDTCLSVNASSRDNVAGLSSSHYPEVSYSVLKAYKSGDSSSSSSLTLESTKFRKDKSSDSISRAMDKRNLGSVGGRRFGNHIDESVPGQSTDSAA